jgi:hypothetical protein
MPYFVYRIENAELAMLKQLELLQTFESFKDAKTFARDKRMQQTADDKATYKVMFAENQLKAEELLMETREKPILMEHEK